MKNSSFSCLRSVNNQLHNKLSQQNQYQSYLKRIDNIVDRKVQKDTSPQFYMNFLNKCKKIARTHKETQQQIKLVQQNKVLLDKIMQTRNKKTEPPSQSYHLHMHERRNRQISRINDQNIKIAKRITEQYSQLRKSLYPKQTKNAIVNLNMSQKNNEKKFVYASWNYSPIKQRKLPKLVQSPNKQLDQLKQKSQGQTETCRHVMYLTDSRTSKSQKASKENQGSEKMNKNSKLSPKSNADNLQNVT